MNRWLLAGGTQRTELIKSGLACVASAVMLCLPFNSASTDCRLAEASDGSAKADADLIWVAVRPLYGFVVLMSDRIFPNKIIKIVVAIEENLWYHVIVGGG